MSKTDTTTTKTRVTRPAEGTADTPAVEAEVSANTAPKEAAEEEPAAPAARSRPAPSASSGFKPPFRTEGTAVIDSQGLLVCRAGAEHLDADQRCAVAGWIAETLA